MKVFDTLTNKEVEKTEKQFKLGNKYYPDRFTKDKVNKEPLPKVAKEPKKKD